VLCYFINKGAARQLAQNASDWTGRYARKNLRSTNDEGDGMATQTDGKTLRNELLTVKEVAEYLRVSRVTAWRWCQQGVIPAFRIGRNWRIRRNDLLDLERISAYSPEQAIPLRGE
jgi:excisionase family DNA binding protein